MPDGRGVASRTKRIGGLFMEKEKTDVPFLAVHDPHPAAMEDKPVEIISCCSKRTAKEVIFYE